MKLKFTILAGYTAEQRKNVGKVKRLLEKVAGQVERLRRGIAKLRAKGYKKASKEVKAVRKPLISAYEIRAKLNRQLKALRRAGGFKTEAPAAKPKKPVKVVKKVAKVKSKPKPVAAHPPKKKPSGKLIRKQAKPAKMSTKKAVDKMWQDLTDKPGKKRLDRVSRTVRDKLKDFDKKKPESNDWDSRNEDEVDDYGDDRSGKVTKRERLTKDGMDALSIEDIDNAIETEQDQQERARLANYRRNNQWRWEEQPTKRRPRKDRK